MFFLHYFCACLFLWTGCFCCCFGRCLCVFFFVLILCLFIFCVVLDVLSCFADDVFLFSFIFVCFLLFHCNLSIYLSVIYLSIYLSICDLSIYLSVIYLSIYSSVIYLYIYLSVIYPSIYPLSLNNFSFFISLLSTSLPHHLTICPQFIFFFLPLFPFFMIFSLYFLLDVVFFPHSFTFI